MYFLPKKEKAILASQGAASNINREDRDVNTKTRHIITDNETSVLHGQRMKVTQLVSGAASTLEARVNDYHISVTDVTVSRGVQLPDANLVGIGKLFVIKDTSGSAASTTIAIGAKDTQLIDGDISSAITTNYGVKRFFAERGNWYTW